MRLRNNKNAKTKLLESKYFLSFDEQDYKIIDFKTLFNNDHDVYLEIGMGKGDFLLNNSLNHPNINYIGIEKYDTVLLKAINKFNQYKDLNIKVISIDACELLKIFKKHSISKIYLNFSDPWPKKRHYKRRLTHPQFLEIYQQILIKDGLIEFKTDNDDLFNWTVNEVILMNPDKYELIYMTKDLYKDLDQTINQDNVATEYEQKFHQLNKNINKLIFKFKY